MQDFIFDVAQQDFQALVIDGSVDTPVVVDFWAPWCEPCKQMMPILEQVITAHGGKVKLAKVNIEDNQAIAQQLQIQSVPMVYAFFQGQPVDGFSGSQPLSAIEDFITKLANLSAGFSPEEIENLLSQADTALHENDYDTAMALYSQIFGLDNKNRKALAGLLTVYIKMGQADVARETIDNLDEDTVNSDEIQAVVKAMAFAEQAEQSMGQLAQLEQAVANTPDDLQALFDLAVAQMASGQEQQAVDSLLNSITIDRTWNDGKAREQLLDFFEVMGNSHPITLKGRRRLSTIWFN